MKVSSRYQPKLSKRKILLTEHFTQVYIKGDEQRMVQVMVNLFENELRYCQQNGHIWLSCKKNGDWAEIEIEDSGPGLEEEHLQRLFDRLYRADNHRNRRFGGSGLGLAICKNIVLAHNGTIEAQHSSQGGIKIAIRLPACNEGLT